MDKKWNKVPLAAAISAIVAAPVWATDDVTAINGQASVDNNLSVDYDALATNESSLTETSFMGTTGIVHSNTAAGFANLGSNNASLGVTQGQSTQYDIKAQSEQLSDGNAIELSKDPGGLKDNSAVVSEGTYSGASGILGANVAAGVANVQSNTGALGHAETVNTLNVNAASGQTAVDNTILVSGADNNSELVGGFQGVTGIVGVNVAAGSVNQQSNTVSLAKGDVDFDLEGQLTSKSSSTEASSTQTISGNELTADGATSPYYVGNQALTKDTFNDGAKGLVGANAAAGDLNAQSNNVAMAFVNEKTNSPSVDVSSSSTQNVVNNQVEYINNNTLADSNTSSISSSFIGFQGVAGTNTTAGQANTQTNNASVAYMDNPNTPVSVNVSADSEQTVEQNFTSQSLSVGSPYGNMLNSASVDGGAFDSAVGLIGVNSSAGQGNAQSNNASLAYLDGKSGDISESQASSSQIVSSNFTTVDDPASSNPEDRQMSESSLTSSFYGAQGAIGVNTAAGQNNTQASNVAVVKYSQQSGSTNTTASNVQNVNLNFTSNYDDVSTDGTGVGDGGTAATPVAQITNDAQVTEAFEGSATGVIGSNVAAGQANAQSNNVILTANSSSGTGINDLDTENEQRVSGNYTALYSDSESVENNANLQSSFNDVQGVVGSNVSAGQANAQSNNVSIAVVDSGTGNTYVNTNSLQVIGGTQEGLVGIDNSNTALLNGGAINNEANIGGAGYGTFNYGEGILGVNVSSGQFNAQGNNVSLVETKSGGALEADTINVQASTMNDTSYGSASSNIATLSNSFVEASGVMGVNLAVGVGNGQTNNVSMHAGTSVQSTSASAANIQASVGNAKATNSSTVSSDSAVDSSSSLGGLVSGYEASGVQLENIKSWEDPSSTGGLQLVSVGNSATIDGIAFSGASGVIGVNVSAGVGNLQSNNVSLTVAGLTTN